MDKFVSTTIVEEQNITPAEATQKSKKKSKNKKTNGKVSSANDSPNGVPTDADATMKNGQKVIVKEVAGDTMNAAYGLTEKFEQHLHIAGDGLQMNGVTSVHAAANKFNSAHQGDDHVAQNGYHNPAINVTTTTNNSMDALETTALGALKKSKSKSNKQKNKETNLVVERENNASQQQHISVNNSSSNEVPSLPAATTNTINSVVAADLLHLKNGFHVCMNEYADNVLPSNKKDDESMQQSAIIKDINNTHIEIAQAPQMLNNNNKNSKALTLPTVTPAIVEIAAAAAPVDATMPHVSTLTTNVVAVKSAVGSSSLSADTSIQQQQEPTLATIATQHLNNTINANPTTATIENTSNNNNKNTAKQDEDKIAVANSKTITTSTQEATLSVSALSKVVKATTPPPTLDLSNVHIDYKEYESELQMHDIMRLIQAELSEPYSIYTYRYFIYNWPKLCFLAAHGNEYVGAIVCKLDMHMNVRRGYIAMLAVRKEYRKLKIGTTLVQKAIEAMLADNADEVVLETEMRNLPALRLYENLGFVRDKRLFRYYLNGVDALRLKLWFR